MKRKSKFLTFIISFFPGLGQVYLGFGLRGVSFMGAFFGVCIFTVFMHEALNINNVVIFFGLLPIIWLIAMVDSMILVDKINKICSGKIILEEGDKNMQIYNNEDMKKQNKKIISMLLSIIPGAGHMYIGLQKQGLQLMTIFFFSLFFIDWIDISALMFIVPIVWFYSIFDVMHKVSEDLPLKDEDVVFVTWFNNKQGILKNKNKYIGWIMIVVGIILVADKLALPIIQRYLNFEPYLLKSYLETGIAAFVFIIGGIKLIVGSKREDIYNREDVE